jgi:hypothetical protein
LVLRVAQTAVCRGGAAFGAAAEHANLIYLDYIDCGPSEKIFQSKKFALQPELFKSQTSEPQQLFE